MEGEKQLKNNSKVPKQLQPYQWKKGQSGNPKGRPKGVTMKEYARDYLACMNEEERDEFFNGIPKETIWKMAEGNPKQDTDVTSDGEKIIIMPTEVIAKNNIDAGNPVSQDTSGSSEG